MITLKNGVQLPDGAVQYTRTVAMDGDAPCAPIKVVQYDNRLPVAAITLIASGTVYKPPDGATVKVRMRKPDGHGVYNDALGVDDAGVVYVAITQQMAASAGTGKMVVEIITDAGVKCSDLIAVHVEENPVQEGQIESADEFLTLKEILAQCQKYGQIVEANAANIQTVVDNLPAIKDAPAAAERAEAAAAEAKKSAAESKGFRKFYSAVVPDANGNLDPSRPMVVGPAASVEIESAGDRIQSVTAYGFTRQAGSGDPSPTNVRQIMVGGLQANLLKQIPDASGTNNGIAWVVKNGVLSFSGTPNGPTLATFALKIPCDIPAGKYTAVVNQSVHGNWVQDYFDESQNQIIRLDKGNATKTYSFELERDAKYVTLQFYISGSNAGTYVSDSYVMATYKGLNSKTPAIPNQNGVEYGTVLTVSGTNQLIPLTAPLCEGDTVQTWVKSGCDKVIVLDGITNRVVDGGTYWFNYAASDVLAGATVYGDYVPANDMQAVLNYIQIRKTAVAQYGTTAEALNEYFASHPLTVWYRSTNYTEADDIAVSLETHVRYRRILDGTEGYYEYRKEDNTETYFGFAVALRPYTPSADGGNGISSHFKFGNASSPGYYPNSFVTHPNGDLYIRTEIEGVISPETMKEYAKSRFDAGSPMTFVYKLAAPLVYAHPAVVLEAATGDQLTYTVTGQSGGTVSVALKPFQDGGHAKTADNAQQLDGHTWEEVAGQAPVRTVNGKKGAVQLTAADVGAAVPCPAVTAALDATSEIVTTSTTQVLPLKVYTQSSGGGFTAKSGGIVMPRAGAVAVSMQLMVAASKPGAYLGLRLKCNSTYRSDFYAEVGSRGYGCLSSIPRVIPVAKGDVLTFEVSKEEAVASLTIAADTRTALYIQYV